MYRMMSWQGMKILFREMVTLTQSTPSRMQLMAMAIIFLGFFRQFKI
jgi:hypothetical protein